MVTGALPTDGNARSAGPFLIAHRAGNELARLRRAEALGVRFAEADLHLFAGRVEVRHLKTVGPVPVLWDRWQLAPPWAPRLLLDDLLDAASGRSELILDLKGRDARLAARVATAVAGRPVTVCSQSWDLLEPLTDVPGVRVVHSVGNARQLAALRRRYADRPLEGISIHRRLLDAATVRELRGRAELVMSWPVETSADALGLAAWGVQGLITSRFEELAPVVGAARPEAVAA